MAEVTGERDDANVAIFAGPTLKRRTRTVKAAIVYEDELDLAGDLRDYFGESASEMRNDFFFVIEWHDQG
jgi:hypothetical protein